MKRLIIGIIVLWTVFALSSLIWSSKGQPPSETFTRLLESPPHRLTSPYENGYYYLLGFAADTSHDPAKVGYEMWLETADTRRASHFDYDKSGRSDLQIQLTMEQIMAPWNFEGSTGEFKNMGAWLQATANRDHTLLARYERWLAMPFEDMGYGRQGIPQFAEIFVAHRLYVRDGLFRQTTLSMDRLKKDMDMWRTVLRDATTIATKVMAQIVITDDLHLLSTLLSQPTIGTTILAMASNIATPLTAEELSLRWPLQHQFTLGVRGEDSGEHAAEGIHDSFDRQEQWLTTAARLPSQAFRQIAHPPAHSFLGIPLQTRETWEMYATYYEAMIHAAEAGQTALPKLHELAGPTRQGILERLASPHSFEPDWGPFHYQLRETDARLRLVSLQAALRRPSAPTTVPNRLAQVGSSYYDPFSGLPMLWSPTQKKIYSVGKDRYDDGGDPSFDISTPAIITSTPGPKEPRATASVRQTNRR